MGGGVEGTDGEAGGDELFESEVVGASRSRMVDTRLRIGCEIRCNGDVMARLVVFIEWSSAFIRCSTRLIISL